MAYVSPQPRSTPQGKSADAFRTISEVSEELDVPQHVLRFWESKFAQVRPLKRGGGRRYYRPDDIDLLRGIRILLYADGYTIRGVQKLIKAHGVRHVAGLGRDAKGGSAASAPAPDVEDSELAAFEAEATNETAFDAEADAGAPEAEAEVLEMEPDMPMAAAVAPAGLSDEQRATLVAALDDLEDLRRLIDMRKAALGA